MLARARLVRGPLQQHGRSPVTPTALLQAMSPMLDTMEVANTRDDLVILCGNTATHT